MIDYKIVINDHTWFIFCSPYQKTFFFFNLTTSLYIINSSFCSLCISLIKKTVFLFLYAWIIK